MTDHRARGGGERAAMMVGGIMMMGLRIGVSCGGAFGVRLSRRARL
jgi:hypothetical protein